MVQNQNPTDNTFIPTVYNQDQKVEVKKETKETNELTQKFHTYSLYAYYLTKDTKKTAEAIKPLAQGIAFFLGSVIAKKRDPLAAKRLEAKGVHKAFDVLKLFAPVVFGQENIDATCKNIGQMKGLREGADKKAADELLQKMQKATPHAFCRDPNVEECITDGVCFSAVMDAFSQYHELPEGEKNRIAFKNIINQYNEGVSPDVCAIQAVYQELSPVLIPGNNSTQEVKNKANTVLHEIIRENVSPSNYISIKSNISTCQDDIAIATTLMGLHIRKFLESIPEGHRLKKEDCNTIRLLLHNTTDAGSFQHANKYSKIDRDIVEINAGKSNILADTVGSLQKTSTLSINSPEFSRELHKELSSKLSSENVNKQMSVFNEFLKYYNAISDVDIGIISPPKNTKITNIYQFINNKEIQNNLFSQEEITVELFGDKVAYGLKGLKVDYSNQFSPQANRTSDDEVLNNLDLLKAGSYYMGISVKDGGHALGFVKYPDGSAHIFDPNGALIFCRDSEDQKKQMQKLLRFYSKPKGCSHHRIEFKLIEKQQPSLNTK